MTVDDDALRARLIHLGYDPDDPELYARVRAAQADRLRRLRRVRMYSPLSVQSLWRADQAECDQRRAVLSAMIGLPPGGTGVVLGGNRSGKSHAMLQWVAANLLGGDHPSVRTWCAVNDLPADAIPRGPGTCFLSAPSSADSITYHRGRMDELFGPIGKRWHNQFGKGEAVLRLQLPGHRRRAELFFKSVDQGRKAYQGASCRAIGVDEEPLGEEGREVYEECRMRVADQGGRVVIGMYPGSGLTWVYHELVATPPPTVRVVALDALDNPHLPREVFDALYAEMSEEQLARRRYGQFRAITGAIYGEWRGSVGPADGPTHVCESFPIPAHWRRWRVLDAGLKVPTAVLWLAQDPDEGEDPTLYVYREHYAAGLTWEQHADACLELEGGRAAGPDGDYVPAAEEVSPGWADPSATQAIAVFATRGLFFNLAIRDVRAGIDAVRERLRIRPDGRPRLKVFGDKCPNLLREFPEYHWDPNVRTEQPWKADDHALDALRYGEMGIRSMTGF